MPDLSVIIVSYNTRELLRGCLRALRNSRGIVLEIIVVDNASADGSAEMVRADFPEVRLLAQEMNAWFCGGNNIGLEEASAEYALLLNPDTEVAPDALALMRRFLDEHPDYAAVTGQLRFPSGEVQQTCSEVQDFAYLLLSYTVLGNLTPGRKSRLHAARFYADWDRNVDRDVAVVPGSCLMMRRADLRLDDDLLLYFPEDDLARRTPGKARFLADARIVHHEKSSTRNWMATRVFFRDMLVYCRKHYGSARALLLWKMSRPLYWLIWLKNR